MKSSLKRIFFALIFAVSLPVIAFLTGCGATPSGKITGILFEAMKFDEATGLPVFEVDKDVSTELEYKIYPSTASGYKVYFDPVTKGTSENTSRFTFKDGTIIVNDEDFEEIQYKIRAGNYSDTCIIRLKEYPVEITTDKPTMVVNSFDIVPINVRAKFINSLEEVSYRNITESDYDFLVETSDETIIQIPNENRLKFCPVRNGKSQAEVTVTLLNVQGEKTGFSFKISVQVIQRVSQAFVTMSGVSDILEDGDTATVVFDKLENESGLRRLDFNIYPVNVGDVVIEDELDYSITLSNKTYAKVKDNKYLTIDGTIPDNEVLQIRITVVDMSMQDGSTFVIDLTLVIER